MKYQNEVGKTQKLFRLSIYTQSFKIRFLEQTRASMLGKRKFATQKLKRCRMGNTSKVSGGKLKKKQNRIQ